jgi:isocitrate/isopropylmalate dehydrogenase
VTGVGTKRVVVIEGEDAAPEAVRPTIALIDCLDLDIEWVRPPVGDAGIAQHGSPFPEEARRAIDASDATLFGATSGKSVAALVYLRWGKRTYANVRPARWVSGYRSPLTNPQGIDFVIVRENLEDLYVGVEGDIEVLRPLGLVSRTARQPVAEMGPGRFALKVITEAGCERVVRFAFELARRRRQEGRPGKVTCATKHNMLPHSDGLFLHVARRVAASYPDIQFETFIVDDFAHRLVAVPHELDVVVLPNLYGDILSDAAAAVIGGLGLAPSGCYGDNYAYFESAHGSAPDIAGKNVINPTATILSATLMLEYLGFTKAARRLAAAVERVYAEGRCLTPDQGGNASTTDFCEAVARCLTCCSPRSSREAASWNALPNHEPGDDDRGTPQ